MSQTSDYKPMSSPLVYPGGKASICNFICKYIPEHTTWVDVFGGGGSVTLYKEPSKVEVYNDIGMVSLFFALIRIPEAREQLMEKLRYTPVSEDEFQYCRLNWKFQTDPIEQVRQWYVQVLQCFTHEENGTGWIGVGKKVSMAKSIKNHVDSIPDVAERFREIQITHRHFREIIKLFDDPDTLFYCDPPYRAESGDDVEVGYLRKMTMFEHHELLYSLNNCKAQVMLSGYNNPLYEEKLKGWEVHTLTRKGMIKNNAQDQMGIITDRTECLWVKKHDNRVNMFDMKKPPKADKPKKTEAKAVYHEELATLWSPSDFS